MLFPSYRTIDHRNNLTSHPWRWLVLPQMQVEILITQAEQIERERRRALLNEYELEFFSLQHQNFVQSEAALAMNPGLKQGQVAVVVDDAATARTRMSSVATSAVHNPSEQVSHVDGEPLIHEDNQVSHVFSQPPPELEPGVAGIASSSGGTGNFAWDDPAHRRFQSSVPPVQINQKNYLIGQQVPDQMVFAGVPPYKARLGTATPYPLLSVAEISTSTATAMFLRRLAGETIGTFLLVFLCTFLMAESLAPQYSTLGWHVDWTGNALGQGLILVFLTLALGEVCGAHFNPCVTWSFALVGKFPFRWVGPYMLFQFGAAVLAGEIVNTLLANNASYGTSLVQDEFTTVDAMYMEAILTFVLVFTILSLSPRGHVAGLYAALATGAAFALCILVGAVISTGSMNPSRSVGTWLINRPARYAVWPFVAGPFIGATIAAIVAWSLVGRQNTFWSLSHSHDNDLTTQSMGKYRQPVARGLSPAKTYWFSASGPALIAPTTTAAPVTIAAH